MVAVRKDLPAGAGNFLEIVNYNEAAQPELNAGPSVDDGVSAVRCGIFCPACRAE